MGKGEIRGRPEGFDDIGPEDTFDGDYGALLDAVYVKGWRPHRDSQHIGIPLTRRYKAA